MEYAISAFDNRAFDDVYAPRNSTRETLSCLLSGTATLLVT